MTFLQPSFADIWHEIDDELKGRIFPLLKGEDRDAILGAAREIQEEMDEESRKKHIESRARDTLLWDEVNLRVAELRAERDGAADSWSEHDIDELFDTEQQLPNIGEFVDSDKSNGGGIFYLGKVNEIHGKSESGKTMVVLAVAAQEIRADRHVIMIDFEDDGRSIVNRLRYVFGLDREQIVKRFHYFRPDVQFTDQAFEAITRIDGASMVLIDAVTEGMSIAQLDGRNENEVATWYNTFPKRLATHGLGVVLIDHTPQDNDSRQIGSQHKKSAVDGVSYTAEPVYPFVKGGYGKLRLKVAKDKPGGVRPSALPQGDGKQFWRGDFVIDGKAAPDKPQVALYGVDPGAFDIPNRNNTDSGDGKARDVKTVNVPPPSLCIILEILATSGEWMTAQKIMEWHNDDLEPKDPRRLNRTAPRKRAIKLIERGLAERRDSGGSVAYRITQDGLHAANAWSNRDSGNGQIKIEEEGSDEGS